MYKANTTCPYVKDKMKLSSYCWILCPEDEFDMVEQSNPDVNVVGYRGKSVAGYATKLIKSIGYPEEPSVNGEWKDEAEAESYKKIMMRLLRLDFNEPIVASQSENELNYVEEYKARMTAETVKNENESNYVIEHLAGMTTAIAKSGLVGSQVDAEIINDELLNSQEFEALVKSFFDCAVNNENSLSMLGVTTNPEIEKFSEKLNENGVKLSSEHIGRINIITKRTSCIIFV